MTPAGPGRAPGPRRRDARRARRRLWLRILGWSLVPLGILGLVLPVLQGLLFLALAAAILSRADPRARLLLRRARRRWPAVDRAHRRAEEHLRLWRGRLGPRRR